MRHLASYLARAWLSLVTGLLVLAATQTHAQSSYPTRTIRLVVPYAAGGGTDALARTLAPKLANALGASVIVDNKPGASGAIGTEAVVRAPADGHTILLGTLPITMVPALLAKPPFDAVADLAPIAEIIYTPLWLAISTQRSNARTVQELLQQVRAEPGRHDYASVSPGSTGHLMGYELNAQNGLDMRHVGYKGAAPATQALLAGEVTAAFLDLVTLKAHLPGGKIRVLAVSGVARSPLTPDTPTLKELGHVGFDTTSWAGLFAPQGTPAPIVEKLADTVARLLRDPEVAGKYQAMGYEIPDLTREQFARQVRVDRDHWTAVIRRAGIKAD